MSHTEDLVKEASEASIKALENNYQESQELESQKTWFRNVAALINVHIFHKIGLHITKPEKIEELVEPGLMGNWSCSGSFESFLHKPKEWDEIYEMLSDDYSKATFDWFVKYRTALTLAYSSIANKLYPFEPLKKFTNSSTIKKSIIGNGFTVDGIKTKGIDSQIFVATFDYREYSYLDKVEPSKGDIVIDAGAYRGDTALYFAPKIGESGIVYAFEPDSQNYAILKENIGLNNFNNVRPIKAGLGYINTKAKQFGAGGGINLQISNNLDNIKDDITIYSIDNFILENKISKIDFIKMDIEGWELDALKGAENCLKNCKPKLAICVYHKPEDLLNIVNYLKLIIPEYNLYLDHKSTGFGDTILYATAV